MAPMWNGGRATSASETRMRWTDSAQCTGWSMSRTICLTGRNDAIETFSPRCRAQRPQLKFQLSAKPGSADVSKEMWSSSRSCRLKGSQGAPASLRARATSRTMVFQ